VGATSVAAAIAGTLVFNTAVERTTGTAPVMPPFLTARVIADAIVEERHRHGGSAAGAIPRRDEQDS